MIKFDLRAFLGVLRHFRILGGIIYHFGIENRLETLILSLRCIGLVYCDCFMFVLVIDNILYYIVFFKIVMC